MSRVCFHSPSGTVELRGSERALFGRYVNDALSQALGVYERHTLMEYEQRHYRAVAKLMKGGYFGDLIEPANLPLRLRTLDEDLHFGLPDGRSIGVWTCGLNTLLATGSDPMILAARIHAQCETHCYVEGHNRGWLAGVMQLGCDSGIFRPDQGWDEVIPFIQSRGDEPVALSYSVCDSFPNAYVAEREGTWVLPGEEYDGEPWDAWYDLEVQDQWNRAMEAVRSMDASDSWLELRPDRWAYPDFHFRSPITGFHVNRAAGEVAAPVVS